MDIMDAYAVVGTGGKQYLVKAGDTLKVELLEGEAGSTVTLDSVLALSDGKTLTVGTPFVKGAKVSAEIVERVKAPKVVAFKKKRRKGYKRKVGHRQQLTVLRVASIG
jgi:large subunit ribosomal protein L21